jgi:hypothetical protein
VQVARDVGALEGRDAADLDLLAHRGVGVVEHLGQRLAVDLDRLQRVASLLPKAASATDCASSVNFALLATKSVSQFSSSSVPLVVPSSLAMTRPLLAARPSRLATPLRPLMRSCSTALS